MKYYLFSSGSQGNASLIIDKDVHILIDLGITRKQLIDHLENIHLSLNDIDFILLTHEHSDHIKGLDTIHDLTIYGGINSYKAKNYKVMAPYKLFKYKNIDILPIELSHDAKTPYGFIISDDKEKLVYVTDTGFVSEKNMKYMKNADYFIFESNHNRNMLLKTNRPLYVKERIMSEFGHLSNEDCAMYLSELIGNKTKEIVLAHISMEANTYELAKETCINYLKNKNVNIDKISIVTAKQFEVCEGGYEN